MFAFQSPAISADYRDGEWIISREGKGDVLRFSCWGGFLYRSAETEPVGSIHINDGATSQHEPCFSYPVSRRCECGHGTLREDVIHTYATPSEAVEEAAFFFLT